MTFDVGLWKKEVEKNFRAAGEVTKLYEVYSKHKKSLYDCAITRKGVLKVEWTTLMSHKVNEVVVMNEKKTTDAWFYQICL